MSPAASQLYTLSLHDALPISLPEAPDRRHSGDPGRFASSREKPVRDRKSTRLNSSHVAISYAVFCLKKKNIRLSSPLKNLLTTFAVIINGDDNDPHRITTDIP